MPNEHKTRRIAMWSGPRNISTALLRSWGNRDDTRVVDEPLYAFYLHRTGKAHPGAPEIMASGETDWRVAVDRLISSDPSGRTAPIVYQKQMSHHLLPEVGRFWLGAVTNCFLIRDPREVLVSYLKRNGPPNVDDLGFVQQAGLFSYVRQMTGTVPPVIDASDVLREPEVVLRRLCQAIEVPFDPAMLQWPAGPRVTDGVWAKYWYDEVERSTSFQPFVEKSCEVPESLREIEAECRECYDLLYPFRLH